MDDCSNSFILEKNCLWDELEEVLESLYKSEVELLFKIFEYDCVDDEY